ncbi:hypothetical protein SODG_000671 [Sodalis praecaptivus]
MSVTIIGGGMAGATLALALSHLSRGTLQIDLVEARTPERRDHPGFDARAIALAQGTCRELTAIGVWPALASCATAITRVEVSDKGHLGKVQIAADDYQLPALGYVVELHAAGKRLFDLLRQVPGVRLHCPATLTRLRREREETISTLDNGVELNAQLVVAADGSRSPLAAQCGMRWRQRDYQQIAVIANIRTAVPHGGDAFERFTPRARWRCCPCPARAVRWFGVCRLRMNRTLPTGTRGGFAKRCSRRLAGGSAVLPPPASASVTRCGCARLSGILPTAWLWWVMPRKRCIPLPARGLTWGCAM